MKRIFNVVKGLGLIAAAFIIFAGCSGSEQPAKSEGATKNNDQSKQAKPATLRFSWWGGENRHEAYLAAIDAYKKLNPHVTIEAEYQGFDGYQQKMLTQLAGGVAPDIMQLDAPWYPELSVRGDFFVDLYQQKIVDLSGFDQKFMKGFGEFNKKMLGVPSGLNSSAILANKTLADKLGIKTDIDYDWDQILEVGKKLREQDKSLGLVNGEAGTGQVRAMLKQATGNQLFKDDYTMGFTKADLLKSYEWIKKAVDAGVFTPPGESQLFKGQFEQNPKWINQKTVFAFDWASAVNRFKGTLPKDIQVVSVRYPGFKDAKDGPSLVRPTFMYSVSKNSVNVDEALKFVNWLMNDPNAAVLLTDSRGVPPTQVQVKAAQDAGKIDPEVVKGVQAGIKSKGADENALSTNSELNAIMTAQAEKVAFNTLTPEQVANETIKLLEEKLKQLKDQRK